MSWADIKRKYESEGSASQSTEDMAARRVLRACRLTEKALWRAEKEAGTDLARREDSTLWERTVRLVRETVRATAFFPAPTVRDVKSFKEAEDTLLELVEGWTAASRNVPVLVYRIRNCKTAGGDLRALQSKGCADVLLLNELPLPCRLLRSRDGQSLLVDCDAGVYFDTLFGRKGQD